MRASRLPARVAWAAFGLVVVLAAVQTWLFVGWSVIRDDPGVWPVLTLGLVLWAALGAVIVSRHPRHPVAWLFVAGAVLNALGSCLSGYADIVASGGSGRPSVLWSWAVWLGLVLDAPEALLFLTLLFLLFPTGQPPSPRWRPLLVLAVASCSGLVLAIFVAVPPWTIDRATRDDLYAGGWSAHTSSFALIVALLGCLLAAAASVVVRARRARGVERQQLRWLAVSATMAAGGFLLSSFLPWQTGLLGWLRILPLQLSVVAVVAGAALAILRYRLYDLDVVVSGAIVLTATTLVVAAGYTSVVVLVGSFLPSAVHDAFWPSLLATAVVALAFQPLRSRVVRLADRLAYGRRAVPYEALADLGRDLQQAPGPEDLLRNVAHAVVEATGARWADAVLEMTDGSEVAQSWPPTERPARESLRTVFAVTDRAERLGRVELEMPPGRPLRPDEAALVERLLTQSGLALRNLRLETELATQVAELGRQTSALEASRHRLLRVRDDEKARFATALRQTVLPHLEPLPDRLLGLAGAHGTGGGSGLDLEPERRAVTAALDELRGLVRGARAMRQEEAGRAEAQAASRRSGPNSDLVR